MEEYLSNIDFLNVLDHLAYNPPEDSDIFSGPFLHDSHSSHQQAQNPSEPTSKRELPTAEGGRAEGARAEASGGKGGPSGEGGMEFQWGVRERCGEVRQGSKDDTVELNINFKTILAAHLRRLIFARELSPEQARAALAFMQRSPSFKSLAALCGKAGGGVGRVCLELAESSGVAARILSSRCAMATKLQMIKFLEVLRANLRGGRVRRWKQPAHQS